MNDKILDLAKEAGISVWGNSVFMYNPKAILDAKVLAKFAELVAAEEREACAKEAYKAGFEAGQNALKEEQQRCYKA